jgi:hypothetical protein
MLLPCLFLHRYLLAHVCSTLQLDDDMVSNINSVIHCMQYCFDYNFPSTLVLHFCFQPTCINQSTLSVFAFAPRSSVSVNSMFLQLICSLLRLLLLSHQALFHLLLLVQVSFMYETCLFTQYYSNSIANVNTCTLGTTPVQQML